MALTGSIETLSLAGIIQLLCTENKTGFLRVKKGETEYQLFLLDGNIVYAIQTLKEAKLGRFLIRDGVVSEETMQACLKTARETKRAIGKVLLENGCISFETLQKYIYKQILEIFCQLFQWQSGEYHFVDTECNLQWLVVVKLNTLKLVMEALQYIDNLYSRNKKAPDSSRTEPSSTEQALNN